MGADRDNDESSDVPAQEGEAQTVLFRDKQIRRAFHGDRWYFSVVDIIDALTDSRTPRRYWSDLKAQLSEKEGFSELYDKIVRLKMPSPDGKMRSTDTVDIPTVLRIIQSVPSPRAERFKRWLADVGYERIQEEEDPEKAIQRAFDGYKKLGRDDEWMKARFEGIKARRELTDEWKNRGVEGREYGVLTNVVSEKVFGLGIKDHKKKKGLVKENLRDHMTDIELVLNLLGERSTVAVTRKMDAQGFLENKEAAQRGGSVAGNARKDLERQLGESVVSGANFRKRVPVQRKLPHTGKAKKPDK